MKLNSLSKYTKIDRNKKLLIEKALESSSFFRKEMMCDMDMEMNDYIEYSPKYSVQAPPFEVELSKICPKCGKKYPKGDIFCFNCAVTLKDIEDVNVRHIDVEHGFECAGNNAYNDFTEILSDENLIQLTQFEFGADEFAEIIRNIKLTSLKNVDAAIKDNCIDLDSLTILEKIILYTKAFVDVQYKSYGQELGFYRFNTIFVDDRQLDALQITTMLHELTHFLIKEIMTQILCRLLDATKTKEMETIMSFVLSYSTENCLIDEYAAHTVEGRFTLIGYQDYSSFLNIQKKIDRPSEEIEMLKTIGNSLANVVKDIVESFVDEDLLEEIKDQFKKDIMDEPNYAQLKLENCTLLNDEGFLRAVEFIIVDGFVMSKENIEKLMELNEMW